MKIIVCGAGSVGRSIVAYLSRGSNDIIVIDTDSHKLDETSKEWDIQPINARSADMIIAATDRDEVNLVTCQVAHSLFNVPKKIARIDSASFLSPQWNMLYNEENIPVDLVISPEIEIGKAILEVLKIPGTSEVLTLADKTPLVHLERLAPELDVNIVSIVRGGRSFIPRGGDVINPGDEIYFLVSADKIVDTIRDFGMERTPNEKIIIFGGNLIAGYLASRLEQDDNIQSVKIIDEDEESARFLADTLKDAVVIHGEMMSDVILTEAGIQSADAAIAVTSHDKDNLLASLLAKKSGVSSAISLVNSRAYDNLIDNVADNILIDRSSVTISSILQELRKAKLSDAYSLGRGFGELWEIRVDADSLIAGRTVAEVGLPKTSMIGAVCRGETVIFPSSSERIEAGDLLIVFVCTRDIRKVERLLT